MHPLERKESLLDTCAGCLVLYSHVDSQNPDIFMVIRTARVITHWHFTESGIFWGLLL